MEVNWSKKENDNGRLGVECLASIAIILGIVCNLTDFCKFVKAQTSMFARSIKLKWRRKMESNAFLTRREVFDVIKDILEENGIRFRVRAEGSSLFFFSREITDQGSTMYRNYDLSAALDNILQYRRTSKSIASEITKITEAAGYKIDIKSNEQSNIFVLTIVSVDQ